MAECLLEARSGHASTVQIVHHGEGMRPLTPLLGAALLVSSIAVAGCESRSFPTVVGVTTAPDTTTNTTPPTQPILLTPSQANMLLGDTLRLVASGGISGVALSWATSTPGIVVIQSTTANSALLGATGTGTTSVSVTVVGDPTRNAAATITVTP